MEQILTGGANRRDDELQNDGRSARGLFWLFLRLGATAFGGPLAHIALMEREFVGKRRWFSSEEFLDMVGATNLIPGPNSTEIAMHIGHSRAGWRGLLAAGIAFILPAALLMLLLAAFYGHYGAQPKLQHALHGLSAVVVAIIAHALWNFGRAALKNFTTICATFLAFAAAWRGTDELSLLMLAAIFGLLLGILRNRKLSANGEKSDSATTLETDNTISSTRNETEESKKSHLPAVFLFGISSLSATPTLFNIFVLFLKIGSILYGSGYVLISFLHQDFVQHRAWISERQLLDAVAFGQFTPGPLFTTATFIGYLLGGIAGATVATIAIFLPSFCFVALLSWFLKRWKNSPILRSFLDIVNAVSLALMAVVTAQLVIAQFGRGVAHDGVVGVIALSALALLFATKINSVWLLLSGALLGFALRL